MEAQVRKRTLKRLKIWSLIRIIPCPKVYIRVRFRQLTNFNDDMCGFSLKAIGYVGDPLSENPPIPGLYTLSFGFKSYNHLVKTGQYWDENGKFKYKGKCAYWSGQGEFYNQMWMYIKRAHLEGRINEIDYV